MIENYIISSCVMDKKVPLQKSLEVPGLALTVGGSIEVPQLEKSSRILESVAGDRIALF